ncbi:alkaline phosphatase family protein [candidate division CSSED10-310 bacterium]|uniref:Alkaline phosphatase family protein n=1 Tax=candidate division CSSED10-310 bacterium TaxID=2855610 RepID=A0ABV6Z5B0_UNCC1
MNRIVFVNIDGACRDIFYSVVRKNKTNFSQVIKLPKRAINNVGISSSRKDTIAFHQVLNVLPVYTMPNQASLFTGLYPCNHGVLNNHMFDRLGKSGGADEPVYYNNLRAYNFYYGTIGSANRMLTEQTPTVHDYLYDKGMTSAIFYSHFSSQKNAGKVNKIMFNFMRDEFSKHSGSAIDWWVPSPMDALEFPSQGFNESHIFDKYINFDGEMMQDTLKYLEDMEDEEVPNLVTLYFGGNDHHCHGKGTKGEKGQAHYLLDYCDKFFGKFLEKWEKFIDQTIFIFLSDHGHIDVCNGNNTIEKDLIPEILKKKGYKCFNPKSYLSRVGKCDVAIAYSCGMVQIYVQKNANESNKGDWTELPSEDDLEKVKDTLTQGGKLNHTDFIFTRKLDGNSWNAGYTFDQLRPGAGADFVRLTERMDEICCHSSGDIILVLDPRETYRFGGEDLKSVHGYGIEQDSYVPLIFAGNNINLFKPKNDISNVRTVDITPTILYLLGIDVDKFDGKNLLEKKSG